MRVLRRADFVSVAVVAASTALAANYTIDDCPADVPRNNHLRVFGSSCYSFHVASEREFDAAERACERHPPGRLVTIKDAATQEFLYDTLLHEFHYGGVVWIGLSDAQNEGNFVWVDGEYPPVSYPRVDGACLHSGTRVFVSFMAGWSRSGLLRTQKLRLCLLRPQS